MKRKIYCLSYAVPSENCLKKGRVSARTEQEKADTFPGGFFNFAKKSKISFLLFFVLISFSFSLFSFAQSGGLPGQFLAYGVGARALGMGGAFFAVADDASASYWNPAGLVFLEKKEFSFMQAKMFADTSFNFYTYAYPTSTKGTLALSMVQMETGGFEKVSITANPAGDEIIDIQTLGTFSATQRAISLSWGRKVSNKLSFGFSVKNLQRTLDTSVDSFNIIDIAMLQQFSPFYRMAVGVQNVFSMKSGDTDDDLPLTFKLGQAISLFKGSLTFGLDFIKPQKADTNWRFGGEYWLLYWASLRFGVMGTPAIQETDFGVGIKYRNFSFDVSQGIHALENITRFSVSFKMGASKKADKQRRVRALIRQAMAYFKAGYFSKAMARLRAAMDADPGNMKIQKMITRLQNAIDFVPNATGSEEVPALTRRGIIAYVDGTNLSNAVSLLRHAFNKNPTNDRLLSLLNMVEKEANVSELTRKPEGPQIFTYIDQKTYDARQAIYEGKYDLAMRRAQDILELEPNNETALEILGSAFYLMDQPQKAKVMWEKVLEINPNNKIVKRFLQQVR